MIHNTNSLQVENIPTAIFYQVWKPEKKANAVMLVCHGLGEHSGRYAGDFADFYTKAGIVLIAPDLPGHGKTEGKRGHVEDTKDFLDIIDNLLVQMQEEYPGKPVFLYGHSMGGLIVLWHNAVRQPKVNGIISTAPVIKTKEPVQPIKKFMAKTMEKLLPSFCMNNGLNRDMLSQDKEVIKAYDADPLVHDRTSARLGMFILSSGDMVLSQAKENRNSILVMIGLNEGIVSKEAVDEFCGLAPKVDYKKWPDLYHEIHNEPQKEEVFKHTLSWINNRI